MKVRSSVKLICKHCRFITRKGVLRVKCDLTGRHNQRKGFSELNNPYWNYINSNKTIIDNYISFKMLSDNKFIDLTFNRLI